MDYTKYKYIVGYGIGQYYDYVTKQHKLDIPFDYLCDINWKKIGPKKNDIPVISPEQLGKLEGVLVILFSGNSRNYHSIVSIVKDMGHEYEHIKELVPLEYVITGEKLKTMQSPYVDEVGNRIDFTSDIEESISVFLAGGNNHISIGEHLSVGKLAIYCGNYAEVTIGDETKIEELTIHATEGAVHIGRDCLFSNEVTIRNHDSHHIFDANTGERINYSGNIDIADHVWVGFGATLLGNFNIGTNSIVGTRAVTSSSFPKEVVIAGNPARIIRKQVCWSKDYTVYYNHQHLKECDDLGAMKYLD